MFIYILLAGVGYLDTVAGIGGVSQRKHAAVGIAVRHKVSDLLRKLCVRPVCKGFSILTFGLKPIPKFV